MVDNTGVCENGFLERSCTRMHMWALTYVYTHTHTQACTDPRFLRPSVSYRSLALPCLTAKRSLGGIQSSGRDRQGPLQRKSLSLWEVNLVRFLPPSGDYSKGCTVLVGTKAQWPARRLQPDLFSIRSRELTVLSQSCPGSEMPLPVLGLRPAEDPPPNCHPSHNPLSAPGGSPAPQP